jgi:hypothetical protein
VFADNRQDAAFQAGWMRDHARRFRLRALDLAADPRGGTSIGDVVHGLDGCSRRTAELSRALLPEVWQVVPFDESGTKHREERLYFLRIQVLREVATGVKQRLGLEPWGRLKVAIRGLRRRPAIVQSWAPRLGLTDEARCEGIAALLDHLRRAARSTTRRSSSRSCGAAASGDKEVQYGYIPTFAGGPKGVKLTRGERRPARPGHAVGRQPADAGVERRRRVGGARADARGLPRGLWSMLKAAKLLVPVTLGGLGQAAQGQRGRTRSTAASSPCTPTRAVSL